MNNNKEKAITKEIVQKVKEEDQKSVQSKYMAPYFGVTPSQLDEIRTGKWDKLLEFPKKPKRADTVLEAVELLREELFEMKSVIKLLLDELGVESKEA